MHQWFMYLFEQRMNAWGVVHCFECGNILKEEVFKQNTCCYSHILDKSLYPAYAGEQENIAICCPDCHNLYTMRPKLAFNQYKQKLKLIEKYKL